MKVSRDSRPGTAAAACRAWRLENKEHTSRYNRAWNAANREKASELHRKWLAANPEKNAAQSRKWSAENPEKIAEMNRRRRALKRGADGSHNASDVKFIFTSQRGLCATCEKNLLKSGKNKFHVDHIMPLSKGGSDWPDNLQCLCPTCNARKGAKTPEEWAAANGKLI